MRIFFLTLGVGVLGGTAYLLRKYYLNRSTEKSQQQVEEPTSSTTNKTYNFFSTGGDSFPLKRGSKGARVLLLQQALEKLKPGIMTQYGGIDSAFGKGTADALVSMGYGKTVDEALFNQIVANEPKIIFNPQAVAKEIYQNAEAKNSAGVIYALQKIKDVPSYSAANQVYMKLGWHKKKILTDLMDVSFKEEKYDEAKDRFREEFNRIGLKHNEKSGKWSLSGFRRFKDIITIIDTYILDDQENRISISKNTILGDEQEVANGMTTFRSIDNRYGSVPSEHVKYV